MHYSKWTVKISILFQQNTFRCVYVSSDTLNSCTKQTKETQMESMNQKPGFRKPFIFMPVWVKSSILDTLLPRWSKTFCWSQSLKQMTNKTNIMTHTYIHIHIFLLTCIVLAEGQDWFRFMYKVIQLLLSLSSSLLHVWPNLCAGSCPCMAKYCRKEDNFFFFLTKR